MACISSSCRRARLSASGASLKWRTIFRSSSSDSRPLARARLVASAAMTASWQVNALVDATPISAPAQVCNTAWLSRAMVLSGTFTTESTCCPRARSRRSAAGPSPASSTA
mgnify:CR=1 FL=1